MNKFIQWLKSAKSDSFLLLIVIILFNLVGARAFFRLDLTSQKAYSLSNASKEVVHNLSSPLSVKVFFSSNLTSPYNTVEQYLRDLLSEYKSNGNSNFSYQNYDMNKPENQKIANDFGLGPVQIDTVETSGFSSKIAWMGVAITYGDYIATIDSIKTTTDLEYKLTTTIAKIISAQDHQTDKLYEVGYITGHGESMLSSNRYAQTMADSGSGNFKVSLNDIYSIKEIDITKENIPENLKAIIINGPREEYSNIELDKIDSFIKKGGNAIFFVNALEEMIVDQNQAPLYIPTQSKIPELLEGYGIKLEPSIVMDENCFFQNQRGFGKQYLNWAPVVQKKNLNKSNPISKNLGGIIFYQNGPINVEKAQENENLKVTVLATTSEKSWTMNQNIILYPGYVNIPDDKSQEKAENIAVLVEGKFGSSDASSKVIVISSAIVTTDAIIDREGNQPISMFVRNAVDYVSENAELCTMRTKGTRLDFISIKSERFALIIKLLNEFGLALVVVLIGFIVWRFRIARRYLIQQKYNPDDERTVSKKSMKGEKENE